MLLTALRCALRVFLLLILAGIGTSTLSAAEPALKLSSDFSTSDVEQRYAIIVGVSQYRDRGNQLTPLQYAAEDARLLSSTFKKNGYSVIELTDFAADRDHILDVIAKINAPKSGRSNALVFAFSGHGFQQDGINYLAMGNTDITRPERTALSVNQVKLAMAQTGFSQRVLLIDACRNDPAKDVPGFERRFAPDSSSDGTAVMYSTAAGQLSYEDSQLEHGVFSNFVAKGMLGAATNEAGVVTFNGLYRFVQQRVKNHVLARLNRSQIPYIAGERNGDFNLTMPNVLDLTVEPGITDGSVTNQSNVPSRFPHPPVQSNRWRNIGIALGVLVIGALVANADSSANPNPPVKNITLVLPTP